MTVQVPVPILLTKEGKWFVASCPILDIATQGRTEREVKDNLEHLIYEYLRDPDTVKPSLDALMSLSLANIPVRIPEGVLHSKASTATIRSWSNRILGHPSRAFSRLRVV